MQIDDALIDKLSQLARLECTGEYRARLKNELQKMLDFVSVLEKLNTDGVEPLRYITEAVNVTRADIPVQEITHEQALLNAPAKDSDYFRVPKFVEKQ